MNRSYHTHAGLTAIHLAEPDHGRRTGTISNIPAGSTIQVCGGIDGSGMVEVKWLGQSYALFLKDLEQRSQQTSVTLDGAS